MARIVALTALFTVGALYQAIRLSALADPDIWWHLRTGLWMLQNHAIPHDGLFSQSASLPWVNSNWGYDLLLAVAFRTLGLRGLPVLLMALQTAAAAALFMLARATQKHFWTAVILAAITQCALAALKPGPTLISIFLLALELTLLLRSRRSGQIGPILWLPLLFVAWANFDRQFAYGLLALALFLGATLLEDTRRRYATSWVDNHDPRLSPGVCTRVAIACAVATLASPYTYHLHELIWQSATSTAVDRYLSELHSMRFHEPQDYLLMLLAMTAFLALGRRRSRDFFLISLLVVSAVISFRLRRDSWLVAVAAAAVIGNAFSTPPEESGEEAAKEELPQPASPTWRWEPLLTTALVLVVLFVGALRLPRSAVLMTKVAETFPVRASDYVRQNHLPQPLFNSYYWGGFLTWYLPDYPVVIDTRVDLYRDAYNVPYFQLTEAETPLESHPGFAQAQTFLLEAKSPIAEALATLPGFRVAYRDELACVLVRGH